MSSSSESSSSSSSIMKCCTTWTCNDDVGGYNCGFYFGSWQLTGVSKFDIPDCILYVRIFNFTTFIGVGIYADSSWTNLVASGSSAGSGAQSILLFESGASGISGSVYWNGWMLAYDGIVLSCGELSSSSSKSSVSSESYSSTSYSSSSDSSSSSSSSIRYCCENWVCNGPSVYCTCLSNWSFLNVFLPVSQGCLLYIKAIWPWHTQPQQIEVYTDEARTNLVASGIATGTGAQTIVLASAPGSIISGTVDWLGVPCGVNYNGIVLSCGPMSSSSSSSTSSSSSSYIKNWSSSSSSSWSSSSSSSSRSSKSSNSSSSTSSASSSYVLNWSSSSSSSTSSSSSSYVLNWSSSSSSSSESSSTSSSSSSYVLNWSSSSSSSSSTEIRSSSSSSSSYLDYSDDRTIPFVFEAEESNPIWTLTSYGEYVFAGTGPNGVLLRSADRSYWEQIYSVDDIHIKSLYVQGDTLFIGTAPKGQIYLMNLITNSVALSQEIGNEVSNFIYYNNIMYASGGIPNQIWAYNPVKNRWDIAYGPHATIITKMLIFQDKLYAFSNSENVISFDGEFWKIETTGVDNISSIRAVSTEPFSSVSGEFIDRKLAQKSSITEVFDAEDVYNIYPMHYSKGVGSADVDGNSLVVGSSNYSKVYNLINGTLYPIFQTEELNTIHSLLNLDVGVNLASVDNKLYLIYCGEVSDATTTRTTTTIVPTATTTTTTSRISIFYPTAGENLVVGTTITIQWFSGSSINDQVKIDLYKGNDSVLIINPSTSNDGTYDWDIPSSLIPGADYKIVLTWLSALPTNPGSNISESGRFGIWYAPFPTTTTTTTTLAAVATPSTTNSRGIPLLDLTNNEYITFMMKDVAKGGILFATSSGRIIGCEQSFVNAYLTGNRDIYAEVKDGFGNVSDTAWTSVFYGLYNKIAEVNEQKEIVKWKYVVQPSAILTDRITGIFLGPILSVKQDLNFWKQLIWQETKPDNTEIIICVRAADSEDLLKATSWDYCFVSNDSDNGYGSTGFIIRELKEYQIKGKYLQFKVTMTTDAKNVTPSVLNVAVTYSTKFATYFFTTKFALQNQSNVQSGMFVANMTEPINTEIKFGIAGTNSADWNDYEVVPIDNLFSLSNLERLKVGIKMIAYDENVPEVAEFSLMSGSSKINSINEL